MARGLSYPLPCLIRRKRKADRLIYTNLLTSGKLNAYLANIDRQVQGITECLKEENALEWIGRLNNIRACAMEIVEKEIIFA